MTEKNPYFAATFAERKAIREAAEKTAPATKQVDEESVDVEDKAVAKKATTTKRVAKKP